MIAKVFTVASYTMPEKKDIDKLLTARKYDPNFEPEPEQILLKIEGQNVGSLQNFITITGMQKSGKSKYIAGIIAAALSKHEVFGIECRLPAGKKRVALFDTEQSDYDFFKEMQLIKKLIGVDIMPTNFDAFNMREDDPGDQINAITRYIEKTPECGLLFVDGALDLLNSYNDETESKRLVNLLKRITKQGKMLAVIVLHRSKNSGTTLGHFGSMADRAAQSNLIVEKNKDRKTLVLRADFMRSADDFTPIEIFYNRQAHTWERGDYIPDEEEKPQKNRVLMPGDLEISEHRLNIARIFNSQQVQSYSEVIEGIKEIYAIGTNYAKKYLPYLLSEGILFRNQDGKYTNERQARLYMA